jgi:hypothetical protein
MTHATIVLLLTVGLFFGMLLFFEIGRRARLRRLKEDRETSPQGISSIDGAVFALLELLIAFTFSGATARLDTRRRPNFLTLGSLTM